MARLRQPSTIFVPIAVLLLLTAGLWILFQNEQGYRGNQQRSAEVHAEILAASVIAAIDFQDYAAAKEAADALGVNRQILAAGIYDAQGQLFAGFERPNVLLPKQLGPVRQNMHKVVEVSVPVMRSGTRIGTVTMALIIDPLSRRLTRYSMATLLVVLTALALAFLGYGQAALRRANHSLEEANRELQVQMDERGRTEAQLREAQKMQALGKLTGGIAHDFNNLLAVIQGGAEILQRPNLAEDKRLRFTNAIIDATTKAASLTAQLLAFGRRQPLKPEILDLNGSIEKMLVMLQPSLGPTYRINTRLAENLDPVEVDPAQFEAALLNIIVNARDAMPEGGEIIIRTRNRVTGVDSAMSVVVSVEDHGVGIARDELPHVFEPFFTTKVVGKGTGLGLSQVYGFAAQSGGEALIESEQGKGTIVTMRLPASDKAMPQAISASRPFKAGQAGGTILLVEDNKAVGDLAEALLQELGHDVTRANSGNEALDIMRSGATFEVVFSDIVMPGMSGLELAAELRERHPEVPIVLTTGYSDRITAVGSKGFPVVRKPYRLETLAAAIDEALGSRRGTNGKNAQLR